MLCFNIVWIPPDVKATFPELLLWQGTMQWLNEKKQTDTQNHTRPPLLQSEQPWVVISIGGISSPPSSPSICLNDSSLWPVSPLLLLLLHFIHTFYLPLSHINISLSSSLPLFNSFVYNHLSACVSFFFAHFLHHFLPLLSQLFALSLSFMSPRPPSPHPCDETASWLSEPQCDGLPNGNGWSIKTITHRDIMFQRVQRDPLRMVLYLCLCQIVRLLLYVHTSMNVICALPGCCVKVLLRCFVDSFV